jgi:hypothetical protein
MEEIMKLFAPVTALLNDFVRMFDEEYSVEFAHKFCADNIQDIVYYTVVMPKAPVDEFVTDFVERFPACSCFSEFMLSFMHELGHLETEWDMVDDVKERNEITDNKTYFQLYNERIATDWAGEYLTENKSEMMMIDRQVMVMLNKIWKGVPD